LIYVSDRVARGGETGARRVGARREVPTTVVLLGASSSSSAGFAPVDPATGLPLDAPSYLALASLSPWVPSPDAVVRRALEVSSIGRDDVHVDLGCGDGRFNFAAIDMPFGATVVEGERERYRRRRRALASSGGRDDGAPPLSSSSGTVNLDGDGEGASSHDVTRRMSRSTVVTAYFVDDALRILRPYLASLLGGRDGVRVVTVGYEMGGATLGSSSVRRVAVLLPPRAPPWTAITKRRGRSRSWSITASSRR